MESKLDSKIKPPKKGFFKKVGSLNHSGLITNSVGNVFIYLLAHNKVIMFLLAKLHLRYESTNVPKHPI